jgi:transcription elongation factor GreA-like protein
MEIIQLNNKKKLKERDQRIIQNAIKHKALRALKKICKNSLQKCSKSF